jgi:hypothetical protein
VIGDVAGTEDPLAELFRRGFTLSPDLARAIQSVRPTHTVSLEKRRQLAQVAGRSKVSLRVGTAPVPPVVARFAPDDYDIIAGVRTAVVDQVLNGLHQTRTIPRVVPLETLLPENDRKLLATSLTGIFGNIPPDAVAGNIILRGPLSAAALDRTDALRLSVPFTLEIVRFVDAGGVRTRVVASTLVATLGLVVSLGADVRFLASREAAQGGTSAATAAVIICAANPGLVAKSTVSGTPAASRRVGSSHHALGRYKRRSINVCPAGAA